MGKSACCWRVCESCTWDARTNILVISDHGFSYQPVSTNIGAALARAHVSSGEAVVASNGESALLFVKEHNPSTIQRLVTELYQQTGVGVGFTTAQKPASSGLQCMPNKSIGWVSGIFSLDFIHECNPRTGAYILIAMRWDSETNPFGTKGTHVIATMSGPATPPASGRSGHGGF